MTAGKNELVSLVRASSWFVAANIFAGFFNYLYQVLASRELSAEDFAHLNAWFAGLALFFLVGGLLQYAANFFPAPKRGLQQAIVLINLFCIGLISIWILGPEGQTVTRAVIVLLGAAVFGWMTGQVQSRQMFSVMALAGLLVGAVKVALVFVSTVGHTPLERYSFALFACYLPALWFISYKIWAAPAPAQEKKYVMSWQLWAAPLVLSAAAAFIPQIDMVVMSRIQSATDFQEFARASLFYKGIYFLMFIVAQWLLPQQIRSGQRKINVGWLWFAAAATFTSAALTASSPFVAQYILRWDHAPDMSLIFLSCFNMSLLTWIFFEIQSGCSRHQIRPAAIVLAALAIEAGLQMALAMAPNSYLIAACIAQAILVTFLTMSNRQLSH